MALKASPAVASAQSIPRSATNVYRTPFVKKRSVSMARYRPLRLAHRRLGGLRDPIYLADPHLAEAAG